MLRNRRPGESRRNCILFHGVPETTKDTGEAVLNSCSTKLGMNLSREQIDRSHRLGNRQSSSDDRPRKPRPIVVKFISYETRRVIFTSKRKFKGCTLVIKEHLTKHRADILHRATSVDFVKAVWTTYRRFICLLQNGRKVRCRPKKF